MGVTLQVVGASAHKLGGRTEHQFVSSGTIGRAEGNTLVLPDPERFISSNHAAIEERADGFYLVDKSINGTYVNGADQPIGHGNAHRLMDGDRIRIGEFELVAMVQDAISQSSQWPQTSQSSQWPQSSQSSQWPPPADPWQSGNPAPAAGGSAADPLSRGSVDPLDLLGGQARPASHDPLAPSGSQPVSDQPAQGFGSFTPPAAVADPFAPAPQKPFERTDQPAPSQPQSAPSPPAGGSVIPEDWDKTSLPAARTDQAEPAERSWNPPEQANPPAQGGAQSGLPSSDPFAAPPSATPSSAPAAQQFPDSGTPAGYPPGTPGSASPVPPADPMPGPAQGGPLPGIPAPGSPTPGSLTPPDQIPGSPVPGGGGLALMLETAGLDQATARALDNPATAQVLGQVLKLVVGELMEVLRARAQIKNQFRVPMTQISASENNPLKFCADELDALQRLLVQEGRGFQGIVEAIDEGFDDVKAHQMAMMAGMRAAFDHLLSRFDPTKLRKEFDQELRRSPLFQPLNKNRYWDMLEELYADISRDSDSNFSRLFGDEFARAYEEQMRQLSDHRKRAGR